MMPLFLTTGTSEGAFTAIELFFKGYIGILVEREALPTVSYTVAILLTAVIGYFLGAINFAMVISRLKFHDDIRRHGSGNAGATNMIRTYGKAAGIATFVGDLLKAFVAVMAAQLLVGSDFAYLAGFTCMLGHAYPCYYHFKGGKGVSVMAAVVLTLDPLVGLLMLCIFAAIVAATKYVSLGSMVAAMMTSIVLHNVYGGNPRVLAALACGLLIVWLHRENIKRLLDGKENKFHFGKGNKAEQNSEK